MFNQRSPHFLDLHFEIENAAKMSNVSTGLIPPARRQELQPVALLLGEGAHWQGAQLPVVYLEEDEVQGLVENQVVICLEGEGQ